MECRETLLRIEGLVTRFGDQVVHDGLDMDICRGEILGVVGGSGAGKSVLVRTILGLNQAEAGHIWLHDLDVVTAKGAALRRVQRSWGVLFQRGALFSGLTVLENIEQPMRENRAQSAAGGTAGPGG